MAQEKKTHFDEEKILLLNKGKRGLLRLIFGRTGIIALLLAPLSVHDLFTRSITVSLLQSP